jgi:hypothetical protein
LNHGCRCDIGRRESGALSSVFPLCLRASIMDGAEQVKCLRGGERR